MATAREEAAPTFESWKLRLERAAPDQLQAELEQFLQVLAALGTPMIDGAKVHFVYHDPAANDVTLAGEFNELRLYRDPNCPACGEHAHPEDLPTYEEVCAVPAR